MDQDEGAIARERIVRHGIERAEWQFANFVTDKGREPVVFGFNMLDPYGRGAAEQFIGKEQAQKFIDHYDPEEHTPVFWVAIGPQTAPLAIDAFGQDFGQPIDIPPEPPNSFLVVGVSHDRMLFRWLPKPAS